MQMWKLSFAAVGVAALLVAPACSSKPKAAPAPAPVEKAAAAKPVKVKVKGASHVGAGGERQPIIEIRGIGPEGWTFTAKEKIDGNNVNITVWGTAPEDGSKGADAPFTIKHTVSQLGAGATWAVRVLSNDGAEKKRLEFTY